MAFDKLVDSAALEANLKTVADAIREKAGTSGALAFPAGFAEAIAAISAGGGESGGGKKATGTVTTNGALNGYYELATLDFTPSWIAIMRTEEATTSRVLMLAVLANEIPARIYAAYYSSRWYANFDQRGVNSNKTGYICFDTTSGLLRYYNSSTTSFMDGTYFWIAVE